MSFGWGSGPWGNGTWGYGGLPLTGDAASGAVGTASPNITIALSGVGASGNVGSVTAVSYTHLTLPTILRV